MDIKWKQIGIIGKGQGAWNNKDCMEGNKEMIMQGGTMEVQESYTILKKNLTKAYVLKDSLVNHNIWQECILLHWVN